MPPCGVAMSDEVRSAPAGQQDFKAPAHLHPLTAAFGAAAQAWTWLRSNARPLLSRWTNFVVANFNTLVVKLPWAIVVVFVVAIVIRGLTEHVTVIEPLSVPKELEDRGYTPEVAGKRMRDAVNRFASSVNTSMKNPEIALPGELPNIVVPTVGLSLDAIVASIRTLLRSTRSRSVTGEFTSVDKQLWLRLRLDSREIYSSPPGEVDKPDDLLPAAAAAVLKNIQPYFAAAAMRSSNPTGAMALANEVIEHRPESDENVAWLYNLKGSILYESGDYLGARRAAEKALALNPGLAQAHLNLGVVHTAECDHDSAFNEYAAAAKMDPSIAAAHNDVAVELNNRGDADGAVKEYETAIKIDSNYGMAHSNLGNLQRSLKKDRAAAAEYAEAITQYRRHLEGYPKDAAARLSLANVLRTQGDAANANAEFNEAIAELTDVVQNERAMRKYDDAAAAYQEAIELNPDAIAVHRHKGEALRLAKKYDEAVGEFRLAIKAEPKYASAHNDLGITLGAMGKHDDAMAEFRAAVAVDPHYPLFHENLGLALQTAGKPEEAAAEYRKALETNPRYSSAYIRLGHLFGAAGKRDEAIAEYRKAINADAHNAVAHLDLAIALKLDGKIEEAIPEYRTALDIDPSYILAREHLAVALREQGDKEAAVAEFRKILTIDPNNALAQRHLKELGTSNQ